MDETLAPILRQFPFDWSQVEVTDLGGAGGFSGARLWRLTTDAGVLCLRRWPTEHPDEQRLRLIHRVLVQARSAGLPFVPAPHATLGGAATIVRHAGTLWELTDWLPGQADFCRAPTDGRLRSACETLAQFHIAVAPGSTKPAASPGIRQRLELTRELLSVGLQRLVPAVRQVAWPEFRNLAEQILERAARQLPATEQMLKNSATTIIAIQPVIRDIWHDHVLFLGEQVSGLVDFGAVRHDTVAADLGRLLGSLVGDDRTRYSVGLAAYEAIRPLSAEERRLIEVFDRSTVVLSGLNWIRWIAVERRHFDDRQRVLARIDEWLGRLRLR